MRLWREETVGCQMFEKVTRKFAMDTSGHGQTSYVCQRYAREGTLLNEFDNEYLSTVRYL